jgi:hypothetical protein
VRAGAEGLAGVYDDVNALAGGRAPWRAHVKVTDLRGFVKFAPTIGPVVADAAG